MGRLIEADSLRDRASEYALSNDEYERFCKIIESEPTACDVDAVAEQLMILHEEGYCPNEEDDDCVLSKTCSDCYRDKLTEIIRKGVLNE